MNNIEKYFELQNELAAALSKVKDTTEKMQSMLPNGLANSFPETFSSHANKATLRAIKCIHSSIYWTLENLNNCDWLKEN